MRGFLIAAVVLALSSVRAGADRIYLENGKAFDDVVLVSQTEHQVRFRVASGEMTLPTSWIARVERVPGDLEEYLRRQGELAESTAPSATAYLELARWARARGLDHGFREALLLAAELEPGLDGLPPLMASLGYSMDRELAVWVSGGHKETGAPAPQRAVDRSREAVAARSEEVDRSDGNEEVAAGLARAIETLAQAELERTRRTPAPRPAAVGGAFVPLLSTSVAFVGSGVAAGWVFPGVPLRGPDADPSSPVIRNPANPAARALLARLPGSLLPVSAHRH